MMGIALSGAKVLHELGHAYVAKHFGCKVPTIGVALLVLWPVLYTDATDAWRLTSRRQRLLIDAAGMAVELSLAVFATLLWSFLPDGAVRSAVFLLATTTWIVTLLVNLNPFMRFDGYYLLSDLLGIPNLQDRAFAIARWRLREFLFGWGENPPEQFGTRTRRVLYFYAYGTWIYRFFLFLGIAVLVYFLFFKLLGIFLMVVELVWFIGMPFYKEFNVWAEKREHMRFNLQSGRTLTLLALLLGLFLFPWQSDVAAPALWRAQQQVQVYTPGPGRVAAVAVRVGDQVTAGQPIVSMASPDLDYEIAQGEKQVQMLQWQTQIQSLDTTLQERSLVSWQELEAETARQKALLQERERLQVTSPIDGVVMEMLEPLVAGDWLAESELREALGAGRLFVDPETKTVYYRDAAGKAHLAAAFDHLRDVGLEFSVIDHQRRRGEGRRACLSLSGFRQNGHTSSKGTKIRLLINLTSPPAHTHTHTHARTHTLRNG